MGHSIHFDAGRHGLQAFVSPYLSSIDDGDHVTHRNKGACHEHLIA